MIYEYALEPELVATWTDRTNSRYFVESFELGRGRIVSRYPKRWKYLVWRAFDGTDVFAQKRLVELLNCLSEQMVRRSNIDWQTSPTNWLENAEREHLRRPFHAILARANPRENANVLTMADIFDSASSWTVSRGRFVARNHEEMASVVAPVLRCSSIVIFIDPYFHPDRQRYRRPFETFLERTVHLRPCEEPTRVEVHTVTNYDWTEDYFRGMCETRLPQCIPEGMRVLVRQLSQKPQGEKLHNRYILTDLGGVAFGTGLDEGVAGETDDVTLMDHEQYDKRWSQYGGDPPVSFNQDRAPFEVVGTRQFLQRS